MVFSYSVLARQLSLMASVAMLFGVLSACSKPAPLPEPVRAVKLLTVGLSTQLAGQEFAGEVRARQEPRLAFQVGGRISVRAVELGQHVKAGQLLAQIDPKDVQLASEAARAQATAARTQRDLAAAEFKRFTGLREQNFISEAELQRREAALNAAQASLDQAQAQLNAQANQASYTRLLAPAAGVVTALEAEAGQVVAAGAPVLRLALDGPREVVFAVPEDQLAAFNPGLPVSVRVGYSGVPWAASVREVAASADPITRTFAVKVALAAGKAGSTPNAPALGATAHVLPSFPVQAGAQAIKLPSSALRQEGQNTAVWVLERSSMTVRSVPVQLGGADGNLVVVAAGLAPGDQVVVAGVHVLAPGQKVSVYQPRHAAPAAAASAAR